MLKKTVNIPLLYIVVTAAIIAAVAFCVWLYWPKPLPLKKDMTAQLELLQRENKALERERDALQQNITMSDELKAANDWQQALLQASLRNWDSQLKTLKAQYENINRYDHYGTDSIRWYFATQFGQYKAPQ